LSPPRRTRGTMRTTKRFPFLLIVNGWNHASLLPLKPCLHCLTEVSNPIHFTKPGGGHYFVIFLFPVIGR
jgi:hypothetical protein